MRAAIRGKREGFVPHHCHWPGCPKQVQPRMWGCQAHWFKLPPEIRRAIQKAYRPGQEIDKNPSAEYIAAARKAQEWIREFIGMQGQNREPLRLISDPTLT